MDPAQVRRRRDLTQLARGGAIFNDREMVVEGGPVYALRGQEGARIVTGEDMGRTWEVFS